MFKEIQDSSGPEELIMNEDSQKEDAELIFTDTGLIDSIGKGGLDTESFRNTEIQVHQKYESKEENESENNYFPLNNTNELNNNQHDLGKLRSGFILTDEDASPHFASGLGATSVFALSSPEYQPMSTGFKFEENKQPQHPYNKSSFDEKYLTMKSEEVSESSSGSELHEKVIKEYIEDFFSRIILEMNLTNSTKQVNNELKI